MGQRGRRPSQVARLRRGVPKIVVELPPNRSGESPDGLGVVLKRESVPLTELRASCAELGELWTELGEPLIGSGESCAELGDSMSESGELCAESGEPLTDL